MHSNRSQYTLTQYQRKLRRNYESLGLVCENTQNGTFKIFRPVPATPWLPEGRRKYFRKLRSRFNGLGNINNYTFCTLTYSSNLYSPVNAAALVKHHIDLFFKKLDYWDKRPQYFYVIELTDKMMVHIHLIFDRYIHKSKIHQSWKSITGCICTKIKHLPHKQAFYYCTKYLSDALKQAEGKWSFLFKHIDRIWTSSRNFFSTIEAQDSFFTLRYIIRTDRIHEFDYIDIPDKSGSSGQFSGHVEKFLHDFAKDHDLFCSVRSGSHPTLREVGAGGRSPQLYIPGIFHISQIVD